MESEVLSLNAETLRLLLELPGIQVERVEEDLFSITYSSGLKARLITYGDDPLRSLQLRAGFSGFTKIELKHMNQWNKRYRFSKCYLDDDGDPLLETDLELTGVTRETVVKFLQNFDDQSNLFFSYLRMIDAGLME
ncbi:putative bacterial sensory transduction regulator [Calidithermus terrae]|uniref:Putative bacterial sensory transduction regulator n=1 Tax=Calidithermus terrae TaxID=1408545 RepID=A0A399EEW5_9DEIN|nr:YbjN domain-containing protein [Calidithermus terrae]RIH83174.1 putative bacterial sensory transduction regulator [Calidithermus terrae]